MRFALRWATKMSAEEAVVAVGQDLEGMIKFNKIESGIEKLNF